MQIVLDAPVTPHGIGETTTGYITTQNVIADGDAHLAIADRVVDRDPDRLQVLPTFRIRKILRYRTDQIVAQVFAAVCVLFRFESSHRIACEVILQMIVEESYQTCVQRGLISFRGQAVVCLGVDNLGSDFRLATHRVNRDQSTRNLNQFKQFGDRRNLITLGIDDDLTETDMIGGSPRADHVNRRFTTGFVVAATERLTIDRNDLSVTDLLERSDPMQ